MTLRSKVARGLKWQVINIAGRQLLSMLVLTTLARLLEPSAFGLVALVSLYNSYAFMVAGMGVGIALIQLKDLEKAHLDTAFWFSAGLNAVLCLGSIVLAEPIAHLLGEPAVASMLRWSPLALMFSTLSAIPTALFTREMDFRRLTTRALLGNAAGGTVGVGLALAGCGAWALVGQLLAASFAGAVFLCVTSSYRPSLRFSIGHLRELFAISMSVFANSCMWTICSRLDQLIIGRFAGSQTLGLYVIAQKIPEIVRGAAYQPIVNVAVPALARLQDELAKLREAVYYGMKPAALVMFAFFVGLSAVAGDLVPLLFGSKWSDAAVVCSLLSIHALVNSLQAFFYPAILASGVIRSYVLVTLIQSLGLLATCLLAVRFGLTVFAAGLIVSSIVLMLPPLLILRRRIGLSPLLYFRPCLIPACASLVMVGAIWLLAAALPSDTALAVRLAGKVLLGAGVYMGFVYFADRTALVNLLQISRHMLAGSPSSSLGRTMAAPIA